MRGRKPAQLSVVQGGLSKMPGAPAYLPAEAKREWRRLVPYLVKRRTLTDADMPTVEAYCLAVGTMRRAQATLTEEGDTVETKEGIKRHPAFTTLTQMMAETRRLAAELGLTPASRNKAGEKPEGKEGFDDPYSSLGI